MTDVAHRKNSGSNLVIFGCGYVGMTVARMALETGIGVTALTRNPVKARTLAGIGARVIVADLASDAWHHEVREAPEFALDCVSSGGGGIDGYRQSYLGGMRSIVRWAAGIGGMGTLVYTSSTSVYPQDHGAWVTEAAAVGGSERADLLVETERILAEERLACRRWFVLRLAGIYGPGRHHVLDQVRGGVISGFGSHRLNLAHRDDVTAAIFACFQAPAEVGNETFNVADDGPAPKGEVAAWLASQLSLPEPRFTGEPVQGRRTVTPDRVISNAKIKARLGWQARFATFRDGYGAILSSRPTPAG